VVMFQVEFFWIFIPCTVVVGYQRFRDPYCLHLQGENGVTTQKTPTLYIHCLNIEHRKFSCFIKNENIHFSSIITTYFMSNLATPTTNKIDITATVKLKN